MDPSEITGPDKEMREKMDRIEKKQARGEDLTQEEKGVKGAYANMMRGMKEEKKAAKEGRLDDYREEHATKNWTEGDDTRAPHLSKETEREVEKIREKQERGETLTRHEAGVLGGAARAEDAE